MNDAKSGRSPGEKQTTVEEGTEFKGTLSSNCPIIIRGKLDGDVSGPSLHVSASGSVSGTVKVRELDSEGELAGQCEAEVVRLSGRVKDRTVIRAKSLEMKLASTKGKMELTFGECELEIGDDPTKEDAATETSASASAAGGPGGGPAPGLPLPGLTAALPSPEPAPSGDGAKGAKIPTRPTRNSAPT